LKLGPLKEVQNGDDFDELAGAASPRGVCEGASGEITLAKAGELLKLSYRQTKRRFARYREEGDKGLMYPFV
jgi:hypothetical protein